MNYRNIWNPSYSNDVFKGNVDERQTDRKMTKVADRGESLSKSLLCSSVRVGDWTTSLVFFNAFDLKNSNYILQLYVVQHCLWKHLTSGARLYKGTWDNWRNLGPHRRPSRAQEFSHVGPRTHG